MTKEVERGPNGKRRWAMDYISDKTLFKAVMFARNMINEGTPAGIAIHRAAKYWRVETKDVAKYTAQTGGTCSHRKGRGSDVEI